MIQRSATSDQQAREALGERLRELRLRTGLTGRSLATLLGIHYTRVSKIENGAKAPRDEEIRAWCNICNAQDQVPDLLASVRNLRTAYLEFRRQTRAGMKQLMAAPVPLYERTTLFRIFEHNAIPGLFQTAEYAAAMLTFWINFLDTPDDLDAAVAVRMERQKVIYQPGKRFRVILEEQALRTWFGDAGTQAGQLDRLLAIMSLPNISVGIIPMMTQRSGISSTGFWLFDDGLVALETPTAGIEITRPNEIRLYASMFEHLSAAAVRGRQARALIMTVLQELDLP